MSNDTGAQLERIVYQMEACDAGPSIFDHFNPDLPHAERFDPKRLLELPEVEVSEAVYWHFLEVLPPACWTPTSFCMIEAQTHDDEGNAITSQYSERGGRYFHKYVSVDAVTAAREGI